MVLTSPSFSQQLCPWISLHYFLHNFQGESHTIVEEHIWSFLLRSLHSASSWRKDNNSTWLYSRMQENKQNDKYINQERFWTRKAANQTSSSVSTKLVSVILNFLRSGLWLIGQLKIGFIHLISKIQKLWVGSHSWSQKR